MKLEVTRDVVSDLWPLCQSGEASQDSRALVQTYLAQDEPFGSLLRASADVRQVIPALRLSPDAELRLLRDSGRRARLKLLILGGSIALAAVLLLGSLAGILLMARQGF